MNDSEMYYSHDPIVEAIIGVTIERLPPERLGDLELLQVEVGTEYPKQMPFYEYQIAGELRTDQQLGAIASASASQTQIGYSMQTKDGRQTFRGRLDGFTYNRLAPYPGWSAFRAEGQRLWALYRKRVTSQALIQGELRYINRLEMPAGEELNLQLEFRFDRLLPEKLAQVYQLLVPDRHQTIGVEKRKTAKPTEMSDEQARSHLCPSVLGSPEGESHHRQPDGGADRVRTDSRIYRAAGMGVPGRRL